jgi:hypothetical protein
MKIIGKINEKKSKMNRNKFAKHIKATFTQIKDFLIIHQQSQLY